MIDYTPQNKGIQHKRVVREKPVILESQGHLFKLKIPQSSTVGGGGPRGAIRDFSPQSRKRMLELVARLDMAKAGFVSFVTLTYPDRQWSPSAVESERDRTTFLKRIKRAYPNASAIWRREWNPRESGPFVGLPFPHYHLLFFGLPFVPYEEINAIWGEVLQYSEYVRTEITGIKSWKHALYYLSKYMAKPVVADRQPTTARAPAAREAGTAGGGACGGEAAGSLVYGTYLTDKESEQEKKWVSIGRSWGVVNRSRLPMAERKVHTVTPGPWLDHARWLASQQWRGMPDYTDSGFSLFVDNSGEWVNCMLALEELFACGVLPDDESVLNPVRGANP